MAARHLTSAEKKQLERDFLASLYATGRGTSGMAKQLNLFLEPTYYHDAGKDGFFTVLEKTHQGRMIHRTHALQDLLIILNGIDRTRDSWISQNEFRIPRRKIVHVLRLNALFVDIDYYNVTEYRSEPPEKMCSMVLHHCEKNDIPLPSVVLYSGHGLQIKWILEKPLPPAALPRWNAMENCLVAAFEPYGSDKHVRDCTRVLRLERTCNTKTDEYVRVLYPSNLFDMQKYDFEYLQDTVFKYPRDEVREYKARTELQIRERVEHTRHIKRPEVIRNITGLLPWNAAQLNWDRLHDLRRLALSRQWHSGGIPDGHRNTFIFLAACFLSWVTTPQNMYHEVVELAKEFVPSWPHHKALNKASAPYKLAVKAARGERIEYQGRMVDPRYRYYNDRLIEWLEIEPDEMRQLQTIITPDIKRERARERAKKWYREKHPDAVNRETYQRTVRERKELAMQLHRQGYSLKDISKELDISTDAVKTYLYRRV